VEREGIAFQQLGSVTRLQDSPVKQPHSAALRLSSQPSLNTGFLRVMEEGTFWHLMFIVKKAWKNFTE